MATEVQEPREYPLYSTTFTIHRLTPLFYGTSNLDAPSLAHHASSFRDLLTGEVLRGVRVGLASEDDALARVGGLQAVRWTLMGSTEDWQNQRRVTGDDTTVFKGDSRGILIDVTYERAAYCAILLHDHGTHEDVGFSNYPLLLMRMPGSLRETLLSFLATTFDTRASPMKLPSTFIGDAVEKYLEDMTSGEDGPLDAIQADKALRSITKDILVTLSFNVPGRTALKSIDVTLSKDDTSRLLSRGRKLQEISSSEHSRGPFLTALKEYLKAHLALDMNSSHVSVSRIACGAFVIGTEGKLKVVAPSTGPDTESVQARASDTLVSRLIGLARGGKLIDTGLS